MPVISCGTQRRGGRTAAAAAVPAAEAPRAPVRGAAVKSSGEDVRARDIGGHDAFAMNLLVAANKNSGGKENIVVSPYSLGVAMSMVAEGAQGETRDEIMRCLRFRTFDGDSLYSDALNIVSSANSIWVREGLKIIPEYTRKLENQYGAQFFVKDFSDFSTVREINGWCSEHTMGRIPSIIRSVNPAMMMYLINALYFKAAWVNQFDERYTFDAPFHSPSGDINVKMMHETAKYDYVRIHDCQVVLLPYKGSRYAMMIVLPPEGADINDYVNNLDYRYFREALSMVEYQKVRLSLPKFRLDTTTPMNAILKDMGVVKAFSGGADFGGMSTSPLNISTVLQKCFLEVNETGSEAAAVTVVGMELTSVPHPVEPVVMNVDRPFLFAILNTSTKNVLFEGKIMTIEE